MGRGREGKVREGTGIIWVNKEWVGGELREELAKVN